METLTCRLLPYATADGATNMAADEVLLQAAAGGIRSLRFYGWSVPTLSLGYFQPAASRFADQRHLSLPWVRRLTGGATLVHHHELTYALALPSLTPSETKAWMPRMHEIIKRALKKLGAGDRVTTAESEAPGRDETLCFQHAIRGDLLCGASKIVGSAQRKHRQDLLQHGAILLRRSIHAPALDGILETCGLELEAKALIASIVETLREETGFVLVPQDWQPSELLAMRNLAADKYRSAAWNEKR